jgi:DNA-binding CsgD family transcriptional regulator
MPFGCVAENAEVPALGSSIILKVPLRARVNPCSLPAASKKYPTIVPSLLIVTPMPAVPVTWMGRDPRWIVCVFDPETQLPRVAAISRDLGVSTREAEIAALLSSGHDLLAIAAKLGISVHTIRTHLKHIFEKTGAHSQSDLVRRVLLSPAMHCTH